MLAPDERGENALLHTDAFVINTRRCSAPPPLKHTHTHTENPHAWHGHSTRIEYTPPRPPTLAEPQMAWVEPHLLA